MRAGGGQNALTTPGASSFPIKWVALGGLGLVGVIGFGLLLRRKGKSRK
jgi:hypothetical protein